MLDAIKPLADSIKYAFIYGSVAKATDTASSDVDLIIVSDELSLDHVYTVLVPLEETLGRKINPTIYREVEFSNKIKNKNAFLGKVLAQPVIELIGSINESRKT